MNTPVLNKDGTPASAAMTAQFNATYPIPRFAHTYCSQCGKDCGPGNEGYSDCRQHGSSREPVNPFAGMFEHEYKTKSGLVLRCYLTQDDHDETVLWLQHAFVGVIDIHVMDGQIDVLSDEIKDKIELSAMEVMKQQAADSRLDAYLARCEA